MGNRTQIIERGTSKNRVGPIKPVSPKAVPASLWAPASMEPPSSNPVMDIESIRARHWGSHTHDFSERDLCLYALGLGCTSAKASRSFQQQMQCLLNDSIIRPTPPATAETWDQGTTPWLKDT